MMMIWCDDDGEVLYIENFHYVEFFRLKLLITCLVMRYVYPLPPHFDYICISTNWLHNRRVLQCIVFIHSLTSY